MFARKTQTDDPLEEAIADVHFQLQSCEPSTGEYTRILDNLVKLYGLKPKPASAISPDTVLQVVGNLSGIALILSWERLHVVTSKALGFVLKLR